MVSRLTGFSPTVRHRIKERAGVEGEFCRCEICGRWVKDPQLHHRIPRGRGGTRRPEVNAAANGLTLCGSDHEWAERNRTEAMEKGWLISQHRNTTPSAVPVLLHDGWFLLDDKGEKWSIPTPAGATA